MRNQRKKPRLINKVNAETKEKNQKLTQLMHQTFSLLSHWANKKKKKQKKEENRARKFG